MPQCSIVSIVEANAEGDAGTEAAIGNAATLELRDPRDERQPRSSKLKHEPSRAITNTDDFAAFSISRFLESNSRSSAGKR